MENVFDFHGIEKIYLTESMQKIREEYQANWLFALVCSYLHKLKNEPFQNWVLMRINGKKFVITCDDGGSEGDKERLLVIQNIKFCNFPLDELVFIIINKENKFICMLPEEYRI